MFGDNPKRSIFKSDGSVLYVKNIFKTLQGEGPYTGRPAIFIRLGGCNLACSFCDTEFEDFSELGLDDITAKVQKLSVSSSEERSISLVVITGGEPFRQPIDALCKELLEREYVVQIETNGTLYQDVPDEVKIICSPKITNSKYHPIRDDLLPRITAFKYLISATTEEYNHVPDLGHGSYNIPVYVQAMDDYDEEKNKSNQKLAVNIALEYGYILSYQLHKQLGIE